MRKTTVQCSEWAAPGVWRVIAPKEIANQWRDDLRFLVLLDDDKDQEAVDALHRRGLPNIAWLKTAGCKPGDVVALTQSRKAIVLIRDGDRHHSLQLTNRCNSYCLMCSQPPTTHNDDWMVEEAMEVIRHMKASPAVLGFSGGEPTLLREKLRNVIDWVAIHHPTTELEVLTNARLLKDFPLCKILSEGSPPVSWLVPIYGHADFLHDFVVQSPGAFEDTLQGILNLQALRQPIQLRIVLIPQVLNILPELALFIGRNLPFVREVALMACESIGFALANREQCETDLTNWWPALMSSGRILQRHAVPFLFMNTPLCALPEELRPHAHKSISDWKNVYMDDCSVCTAQPDCSGFFSWHERGWKPTKKIKVIQEAL
ncbi:His-Xaa-Ser system radical SAM maturase HxsC [Alloalcanivorax xenomutans]|uniref:His-Xaa-Ser system radical SAM maturase HxsC n=1 Tax=Alloalcanivorax xenomutans TaxID=1094342 RepID=UPI0029344028|nr:His-Xaa-Ser system radical SAM maturase HxsC [Alloalcanivorax xenomutans]WOD30054.1 His-Xaa-Ser system radical SAM maturase HxsC [Alloalcanivorax xenomutans]